MRDYLQRMKDAEFAPYFEEGSLTKNIDIYYGKKKMGQVPSNGRFDFNTRRQMVGSQSKFRLAEAEKKKKDLEKEQSAKELLDRIKKGMQASRHLSSLREAIKLNKCVVFNTGGSEDVRQVVQRK